MGSSSCDEGSCNTESCESSSCGSSCGSGCPACGGKCGGDVYECGAQMWSAAFFQAMRAVQVDILKAKIQKSWGSKMDKAADIILEAMEGKWRSMMAETKAKSEVREKLQSLWESK